MEDRDRQLWDNRVAFIMAAVGSAVGLGNVWRFPFVAYQNGGGAFFIPYFTALIAAGIPVMILEYSLGIIYQRGAPGAMEKISSSFKWVGWLALFVGLSISFYYVPVMGWSWHYMMGSPDYTWAEPTQEGTVFIVPFETYKTEKERERIRKKLRENEKNIRLVKHENRIENLKQRLRGIWGQDQDITWWSRNDIEDAKSFVRGIYKDGGATDPPSEIRALLIPHDFLDAESEEKNITVWADNFYNSKLEERRKDDPWLTEIEPDRRVELIKIKENAEKHFNRTTLGGFNPGQWQNENLLETAIDGLKSGQFRTEDLQEKQFIKRVQIKEGAPGITAQDHVDQKSMDLEIPVTLLNDIRNGNEGWRKDVKSILSKAGTHMEKFDVDTDGNISKSERRSIAAYLENAKKQGVINVHFIETLTPRSAEVFGALSHAEKRMNEAETAEQEETFKKQMDEHRGNLVAGLSNILKRQEQQNGNRHFTNRMWTINWELAGWSVLTWVIIFLIVFRGVEVVGKVVMLTVPIPLLLLGVLIIYGLFQPGSMEGLKLYLEPNWHQVAKPGVWLAAFGQVFFTLSLGFGIMIAYASYQPEDSDISNNSFMTAFANCGTSFYAGFAVFSVLGALAWTLNVPVENVTTAGPGLVFNVYPVALMEMPGGSVLGILFFFSLLTLGIDSAFSIVEAVITGLNDTFTETPRITIVTLTCLAGMLISVLFFCNRAGLMWLDIVDHFAASSFGLPLVGLLECIAVGLFFNTESLRKKINEQSEIYLGSWWNLLIQIVVPAGLMYLIGKAVITKVQGVYGGYHKILENSVYLGGWGYFGLLLFLAFLVSGSTVGTAWIISGVILGTLLTFVMDTVMMAVMTTVGIMLLLGGFLTCLNYVQPQSEQPITEDDLKEEAERLMDQTPEEDEDTGPEEGDDDRSNENDEPEEPSGPGDITG